jgi:hypothetical protein
MYKKAIWLILSAVALMMVSNYLTRAILPAFNPSNSDFSELYARSWLWRQGQNPYDPALATSARQHVVGGSSDEIFLVNVPTALVVVAPFTLLPWGSANFLFLMLGTAGLAVTILIILRFQGRSSWGLGTALLIVFLLSFSPLRIAFQWGNIVLLVLPLSILAIMLAEYRRDWQAGLLLGLAVCLKPQIGVWLCVYYLLRGRLKILSSSLAIGLFIAALFFLHPIPCHSLIVSYRSNMQHWFGPEGPYGFMGAVSSLTLRMQGIVYRLTHSAFVSIWIAQILFLSGAVTWGILVWRFGDRIPSSLAIASLLTLSFLSLYHSIPDASVLTIALCDAFPASLRRWTRTQTLTCLLLSLMMLPGRSIFGFLYHHLNSSITRSWWWDVFFVRYFVWLLLALSLTLLLRMREAQAEKS